MAEAKDGLGAIELADEVDIDAAVVDVHMPLVDGVTAVARLRRDHPALCLIAITGDREPQLLRAVEEAGADAVLLKEKLVETLIDRLQHVRHTDRNRSGLASSSCLRNQLDTSIVCSTPPQPLRACLRLALHGSGRDNLNPVVHHERGRYSPVPPDQVKSALSV